MGNSQPKLTPKELARQNKRIVDKAVRQIERERGKLQNNEGKLLTEIKMLAKKNQHVSSSSSFSFRLQTNSIKLHLFVQV
jgi:hypothetical protein